jgi:hypothetical protein
VLHIKFRDLAPYVQGYIPENGYSECVLCFLDNDLDYAKDGNSYLVYMIALDIVDSRGYSQRKTMQVIGKKAYENGRITVAKSKIVYSKVEKIPKK